MKASKQVDSTVSSELLVSLTMTSKNEKTGPIPVSMTTALTCPDACPLKRGKGCYAEGGPLAWTWRRLTAGGIASALSWGEFCARVARMPLGQYWRHNQAGDLPGVNNAIDRKALAQLVDANKGRRGWTFTHKPVVGSAKQATANRQAVADAVAGGFTINLSADNLREADELAALAIAPVAVVLPKEQVTNTTTPQGRKVVICPATQRPGVVTCATCRLCSVASRSCIVGFPAHGFKARKAGAVAAGN